MKKFYNIAIITAVSAGLGLFLSVKLLYSQNSKFDGIKVAKIEFSGMKKVDSKTVYVPLKNNNYIDLLNICLTEVNQPFSSENLKKDIKNLFELADMTDVKVEVAQLKEGIVVRFFCQELPEIEDIVWKGAVELRSVDLESKILIKKGDSYKEELLNRSIVLLQEYYLSQGLFNVIIRKQVDFDENENKVKISFILDEGEDIKIRKITVLGADKVRDYELYSIMELKERSIIEQGNFQQSVFETDKQKMIYYYWQKGYMDAQIVEASVDFQWEDPEDPEDRAIYITYKIDEGEKYYFDGYTIEGNKLISTEELLKATEQDKKAEENKSFYNKFYRYLKKEPQTEYMVFNGLLYEKDKSMIAFKYSNQGYIWTRVIPDKKITEKKIIVDGREVNAKFIHTTFTVIESQKAYIENIIINGNTKTKDKIIRREVLLKEGDLFNSYLLELTREKIFNLGYFKEVNIDIRPGSSDTQANLIITVEEQPTGAVSVGGGYGTSQGFSIFADVSEKNLFGNGQTAGVKIEYGPTKSSISLNFYEPWLLEDKPVSFAASVSYSKSEMKTASVFPDTKDYASYERESIGYSLGLGYRFGVFYGVSARWIQSLSRTLNAEGACPDEIFISQALGFQDSRAVSLTLYRSSKNNSLNPTRGTYAGISAKVTGGVLLRGDDHNVKYSPELELYYSPFTLPMLKNHPVVLQFRMSGDFITPPWYRSKVEEFQSQEDNPWLEAGDRMNIGVTGTLRCWSYTDTDFPTSWTSGLYHRILYGAELRFPIHPQYLWGAFFFDSGALFSDRFWDRNSEYQNELLLDKQNALLYDIRDINDANLLAYFKYSYGFGLRIQIPMLPLRFWFGRKVIWEPGEGFKDISDKLEFEFQIGDMRF